MVSEQQNGLKMAGIGPAAEQPYANSIIIHTLSDALLQRNGDRAIDRVSIVWLEPWSKYVLNKKGSLETLYRPCQDSNLGSKNL